jgi:phosphate transport system substrate-binding protein
MPSPVVSDPTLPDFVTPGLPPSNPATEITSATDIRLYRTLQEVPNVPKGQFSYSSTLAFAYLKTYGMNDRIEAAHPAFQLRANDPPHNSPDSTTAIKMLIDGEVSMAQSARPLETEEVNRARSRQLTLEQIPVAIDGMIFYVHPELPIAGLSLTQIQNIYAGKVTNWKEVGGPDLPIVPISLDPKRVSTPQQALGTVAEKMGTSVQIIRDQAEGIRRVSSTPGAISFAGGIHVVGQKLIHILSIANSNSTQYVSPITATGEVDKPVLRNGTYPLTRRLYVVIRRNRSLDEQAGVAYANLLLSAEGQKLIESIGLVPLY